MEIKDVIHLYLGCECIHAVTGESLILFSVSHAYTVCNSEEQTFHAFLQFKGQSAQTSYNQNLHKLILRQLSSMTEEEALETIFLLETIRKDDPIKLLKLNSVNIPFWLGENKIARYVSFNKLNPKQFVYLLSQGFDLFGLIDADLAINATTLK